MRDYNYYVYILTNKHRTTLYTVTNNLWLRISQHRRGAVNGFTQRYNLNRLVWFQHFRDINNAIARGKQIKSWLRAKKISLIEKQNPRWLDLSADATKDRQWLALCGRNGQGSFASLRMTF